MTHEQIKRAVPDEVRQFYWRGIANGVVVYDKLPHSKNVLAKAPGNKSGRCEVGRWPRRES